jgi:hypothetical protein
MKIAIIVVYFGKWPVWFPAFLQSCKYNSKVNWLFFTDCLIPEQTFDNVDFISFSIHAFNSLATSKLGYKITLNKPYKLCDFKPCYGLIFSEFIQKYDFWGHCDVDIIWGQIRKFITDEILSSYDVISARKKKLCGHFTLYKNNDYTKNLFRYEPNYQSILQSEKVFISDEHEMTDIVQGLESDGRLRVYWPKYLLNFANPTNDTPSILEKFTNRWYWEKGNLYDLYDHKAEIMYLHFMTWKDTLKTCRFDYSTAPDSFYISYSHIDSCMTEGGCVLSSG